MTVRFERSGSLAIVTFDRPEAKNAIDVSSMLELSGHLEEIERDEAIVALVLEAVGPIFVSGGDLKELAKMEPAEAREASISMHEVLGRLEALSVPTIAALDGDAFGGGWEVAVACDLRVMAKHARIHFRQNALGLTPGWGGGQRLLRRVGYSRALLWLSTSATVDAAEAERHGFADELADETASRPAAARARAIAESISRQSPEAVRNTKRALIFGRDRPPELAGKLEAELFARVFGSPDHRSRTEALLRTTR